MNVLILTISLMWLSGCSALAPISEDIKEIANNDAITIKVDKDAFEKDTDVIISVQVINKVPSVPSK